MKTKTAFDTDADDMKLPEGKTCADCKHYKWCEWLFSCQADNKWCDWSPSRFKEKEEHESQTSR